eukprot:SAG31_NODE_502_length_14826_cov_5.474299_9_plen_163_part_00
MIVEEEKCVDEEMQHPNAEGVASLAIVSGKHSIQGTAVGGCGWEHIEYDWIDAKENGQRVPGTIGDDDSVSVIFPSSFEFPFFGEKKHSAKVSSNGYITFGAQHFPYGNTRRIPSRNTPNEAIFVYWVDWNPPADDSAGIYQYYDDRAQLFVIQWDHFPTCA